jgi:transposase
LVFVDESEVHLNPPLTKVWARRGEPARVPAAGDDRKVAVFGAWDYRTEGFSWRISERKDSAAFLGFLQQLLQQRRRGRRLILVMDNAGYHRARVVRDFLERYAEQMEPLWLPPYSPELNLIEYVWGYLKETATNNYFFGDLESLKAAVAQACTQLNCCNDWPISVHFKTVDHLGKAT